MDDGIERRARRSAAARQPGSSDAQERAAALLDEIRAVMEDVESSARRLGTAWCAAPVRDDFVAAAGNLAAYLALRERDLTALQPSLTALGLSSLGRCEAHVMGALRAVAASLSRIGGSEPLPYPNKDEWAEGHATLSAACADLFAGDGESTAIMVTLPSEAATDVALVESLVKAGMGCARINCAHDGPDAWAAMADNVRYAARRLKRDVKVAMDLPGPKCRIEAVMPDKTERLKVGDRLVLAATTRPGDSPNKLPRIAISFPAVTAALEPGAEVWIDDGKLRCRLVGREGQDAVLEVHGAREKGFKLKPDKGVNFPRTVLDLPSLSPDDLAALPTVLEHADVINVSFVQRPEDIDALDRAAADVAPGKPPLPAILKIETPLAVSNLPQLIVRSARSRPTGVMIARGDLAVELGHARLAEIQEEILWLCEAARTPVVWATQVLDDLVKEGLPSRAETTDAAMAQRAECVMLNKGPHVVEAMTFLQDVARRMRRHQHKKSARLGPLHAWHAQV